MLVRFYRDLSSIKTLIKAKNGEKFRWFKDFSTDKKLHEIDMFVGGKIFPESRIPTEKKETYIRRGVIEEAIASSQLEGAHTSRKAARKLILEKRKPQSESEKMIINNYRLMSKIEELYKDQNLSESLLFELHYLITEGTIDEEEQKRFRKDSDEIVVKGDIGARTYISFVPPDEKFVKDEIKRLINYANSDPVDDFIHPVIKAIFIHFWIAYLHPFTDGNGRLARALFYWYLLKNDYWIFSYLPISTIIKKSPSKYAMAYIYSEQDSKDISYFVDYMLTKIFQAINQFDSYVQREINRNRKVEESISQGISLNDRQKKLIFYLYSSKYSVTMTSHSITNNISRQTAAKDLKFLENSGFIKGVREGKYIRYFATDDLKKMFV
jgi:Fic family protein